MRLISSVADQARHASPLRRGRACLTLAAVFLPVLLTAAPPLSPPQQRVEAARKRVQAEPKSWQAYNDLAAGLCRWARDNGDSKLYDQAEAALEHSLQLSPNNYDAQKLQVTVVLGKREFTQALKLAKDLNHKVPDDIAGWGLLVDTNMALGNYAEAERAAQWILDLRPGSSLGFIKAAALREHFGDIEGAIEFFEEANRRTSQNDLDEHAWLLTQNARLQQMAGNPKRAQELLTEALKLFPDSQFASAVMQKGRIAEAKR
jgi:tetratricopeptide (TPR) repeat protein